MSPSGPLQAASITLTVSAAASLSDAFSEIKAIYLKEHPDRRVALNLGGSGMLAVQIARGAPADVFASAGAGPMRDLIAKGFVDSAAVRVFAGNRMVLIVPAPRGAARETGGTVAMTVRDLTKPEVRHIAIGQERTVPAGRYAAQSLRNYGLYDRIKDKLVPCEDVRQVMQYVATGAADAGFVYSSDVAAAFGDSAAAGPAPGSPAAAGVKVAAVVPDSLHDPILYPIAPIKGSEIPDRAVEFVEFVLSPRAQSVLRSYGFLPPPSEPERFSGESR
jgi:molybdate transport system substrate-binding protein